MKRKDTAMDTFDYVDAREASRSRPVSALVINVLTIIVLLATLCLCVSFLTILMSPMAALNPFPPPTLPSLLVLPTDTPTPRALPPTWTPTITPEPTLTSTPRPTSTLAPTNTPIGQLTDTPDPTIQAGYSFQVQQGNPVAISSAAFHPEYGCAWMGVAGQALDMSGAPVPGLIVQLGGQLPGEGFDLTTVTGTATQYGGGSFFEFSLTDIPVASNNTLWVQLEDVAGVPLSDRVYFSTFADCDRNLIIINFKQVR